MPGTPTDHRLREAGPADLEVLLPLVRAYHEFEGVVRDDTDRVATLEPLLSDASLGRIWLIEYGSQTVGYIALCFGYSIEFQGRDAFIDEFYLLPQWRGRGYGSAVLAAACDHARGLGIRALHLEVANDNERATRLYQNYGFEDRTRFHLMTLRL